MEMAFRLSAMQNQDICMTYSLTICLCSHAMLPYYYFFKTLSWYVTTKSVETIYQEKSTAREFTC